MKMRATSRDHDKKHGVNNELGRALKFYSSIRLDIRRIESIKKAGNVIGNRTRVKVVKNKVAPPFKQVEFDILFGTGIDKAGDVIDTAVENNIIDKSGSWFAYDGKRWQGRENMREFLMENPDVLDKIKGTLFGEEEKGEEKEEEGKAEAKPKK